jgi:hypothetical protein
MKQKESKHFKFTGMLSMWKTRTDETGMQSTTSYQGSINVSCKGDQKF